MGQRLGTGCRSGLQLSLISSALSLENSRRSMKTKLPLLKPILMVLWRNGLRCRLSMMDLQDKRMSFHLHSSPVDLLSKKSLTKPLVLRDRQQRYRLSLQEFKTESRAKNNRNLLLRDRLQKSTPLFLRWKVRLRLKREFWQVLNKTEQTKMIKSRL